MTPSPPKSVMITATTSRTVNVSWIAGFDGNSEILDYMVFTQEVGKSRTNVTCKGSKGNGFCVVVTTSTTLEGLLPWTLYIIEVFAQNKVGLSSSSVVNVTTDEEGTCIYTYT